MRSVRLLPIVVMAASSLLVLKTVGIVSGEGYTLTGVNMAFAQEQEQAEGQVPDFLADMQAAEQDDGEEIPGGYSQEDLAAAEAAASSLFSGIPSTSVGEDIIYYELDGTRYQLLDANGEPTTQQVVLQRLAERRIELDSFASELETRLAVVEAAELRLQERMAEISAVEARIDELVAQREAEESAQFASVVAMYAAMRPADAANIFNELDMSVLTRVSREMNPRALGPILAKMRPERAQQLTIRLASSEEPASQNMAVGSEFSHLPQIVGQ